LSATPHAAPLAFITATSTNADDDFPRFRGTLLHTATLRPSELPPSELPPSEIPPSELPPF